MDFKNMVTTLFGVLLLAFMPAVAAYQITTFGPSEWGSTDTALGIPSTAQIENFEDVNLIPGVNVQVTNSSSGSYGPTGTLPNAFNPSTDDCCGTAFIDGSWDGSRVLLNTGNNLSADYASTTAWGDVTFTFPGGATQVGFSLHQMQSGATVTINDTTTITVSSLPNLVFAGGRVGYIRIDATGGAAPMSSLKIDNNNFDGWLVDHLAVTAVPEPQIYLMMLVGAALTGWQLRLNATAARRVRSA